MSNTLRIRFRLQTETVFLTEGPGPARAINQRAADRAELNHSLIPGNAGGGDVAAAETKSRVLLRDTSRAQCLEADSRTTHFSLKIL